MFYLITGASYFRLLLFQGKWLCSNYSMEFTWDSYLSRHPLQRNWFLGPAWSHCFCVQDSKRTASYFSVLSSSALVMWIFIWAYDAKFCVVLTFFGTPIHNHAQPWKSGQVPDLSFWYRTHIITFILKLKLGSPSGLGPPPGFDGFTRGWLTLSWCLILVLEAI